MIHWLVFTAALSAQQSVSPEFDREVRPILERNCLGCHNRKLKMSNFSMATRSELLRGGKRGGGTARVVEAIRQEGNLRMPPSYKMKPAEIAVLERWIAGGANMPENAFVKAEAKPNHWAFSAVKRPAPPQVRNGPLHSGAARTGGHRTVTGSGERDTAAAGVSGCHRIAAVPGRTARFRQRHAARRMAAMDRQAARFAALWGALGAALARSGALCRFRWRLAR
jgi:hypothetical protein